MSADDGLRDEMRRFFARRPDPLALDDGTAARLLSGRLDAADAPPAFADVSRVIGAAAAPGQPAELCDEGRAVAAFRAAQRPTAGPSTRARGTRLAILVTAGLFVLGGVAAAATTGALPDGAQTVAHDALRSVGVSVPAPTNRTARRPRLRPPTPVAPTRPVNHPPARPGLPARPPRATPPPTAPPTHRPADTFLLSACRAYLQGRVSPTGSRAAVAAYRYLAARAGGAGNIGPFCQGVVRSGGP